MTSCLCTLPGVGLARGCAAQVGVSGKCSCACHGGPATARTIPPKRPPSPYTLEKRAARDAVRLRRGALRELDSARVRQFAYLDWHILRPRSDDEPAEWPCVLCGSEVEDDPAICRRCSDDMDATDTRRTICRMAGKAAWRRRRERAAQAAT